MGDRSVYAGQNLCAHSGTLNWGRHRSTRCAAGYAGRIQGTGRENHDWGCFAYFMAAFHARSYSIPAIILAV